MRRWTLYADGRLSVPLTAAILAMAVGCGAPASLGVDEPPAGESSGDEVAASGVRVEVHSSAELRAAERARRLEMEQVEAEHLKSRLEAVHSGIPYHEALLLLGIDESHMLVRRGSRGFRSVYAVAEFELEFAYSQGEEPILYAAVMYRDSPDGTEREIVAQAVAAVELVAPEIDAQVATVGEVELAWTVAVASAVTLKICADPACAEVVWSEVEAQQQRQGRVRPSSLELAPGAYFWRVELAGRATDPRRFFLGATGPAFEPIPAESQRTLGDPLGSAGRVHFQRGLPQWGAQLMGCGDGDCLLLALIGAEGNRFLTLSDSEVTDARVKRVFLPDRSQALLVAFSRADGRQRIREAWVVADEGQGPRVIWKAIVHVYLCNPGPEGEPCEEVRVRERVGFRDRERDGVVETLVLTRLVGRQQSEERFERGADGRFPLPYYGRQGFAFDDL